MGAQIAAHFANAGVPALLLDLNADTARQGLERARKLKPDPFFTPDAAKLIATGGFDTDLQRIAEADWILEAVVEQLEVKRALLEKVDARRRRGSIVSSNTSGIPIAALAEGQASGAFRKNFSPTVAAKALFGALDEMATNWVLTHRKYELSSQADEVVDLFLNGVAR